MNELDLFVAAVAITDITERAAFLEKECAGDPALRRRLEALLLGNEQSRNPLDNPLNNPIGDATVTHGGEAPRTMLNLLAEQSGLVIGGKYTLEVVIGEGGMGSVWRAKQTEPVKRFVAIKLIKAGMDSRTVLARFEAERQALALMDHPNIARIYDGGMTDRGQPYFAMELVEGVPLTHYCDAKRLSVRGRLELFVSICAAIQHAHQKGIIHRDLKPGNVLVTEVDGKPTPKVIDFGVAKATELKLTDMSLAETGAIVGTPTYMSPEQADPSSMDIDTRTDVYALGVMLYELLTGSPPIDSKQFQRGAILEMLRMVREVDPPRPSTKLSTDNALPSIASNRDIEPSRLANLLQGELDWVVMKALEKDRNRRYESANGLSLDLQRYLADEVVEARPPSRGYRLKKFIKRNKAQVTAASFVVLALIAGIIGTSVGLVRARTARENEAEERRKAEKLALDNKELADAETQAKADVIQANLQQNEQLQKTRSILFGSQIERAALIQGSKPWAAYSMLFDLSFCPIELRDVAWNAAVRSSIHQIVGTIPRPASVRAISPDGTVMASVVGGTISILEFPSGKERIQIPGIFKGPTNGSEKIVFTPDNQKLAITSGGGGPGMPAPANVTLLNLADGKQIGTFVGHTDRIEALAFNLDGTKMVSGSLDGTARVWDVAKLQELYTLRGHGKPVTTVAFSPNGKTLATGGFDFKVRFWDTEGFKLSSTWDIEKRKSRNLLEGQIHPIGPEGIVTLAYNKYGQMLAVGTTLGVIEFRDTQTGAIHSALPELGTYPRAMQFHRNGRTLFVNSNWAAEWDVDTAVQLRTFVTDSVRAMVFSQNTNRFMVSGEIREATSLLYDLDAPSETAKFTLEKAGSLRAACLFSPNGDTFVVSGKAGILFWDTATRKVRKTLTGHPTTATTLALSPDGKMLVSANGESEQKEPTEIRFWSYPEGELLGKIDMGVVSIRSLAFSPDGKTLASFHWTVTAGVGLPKPVASVWNVADRKLIFNPKVPDAKYETVGGDRSSVVFSHDGKLIGATGRQLLFWNLEKQELEREILVGNAERSGISPVFLGLTISPDGTKLATSNFVGMIGPEVNLWDIKSGQQIGKIKAGEGGKAGMTVLFSPDGNTLVIGGQNHVHFVDVLSLQSRGSLPVSGAFYHTVALSQDGRTLAAIAWDNMIDRAITPKTVEVKLWDVSQPATRIILTDRIPITRIRFLNDNKTMVEPTSTGEMRYWDLEKGVIRARVDTTRVIVGTWSSYGQRYFAGGGPQKQPDGTTKDVVTVFDMETATHRTFEVGPGETRRIEFSRDASRLVITRAIRTPTEMGDKITRYIIEVFDLKQEKSLGIFEYPVTNVAQGVFATLSEKGDAVAIANGDGTNEVIDLTTMTKSPLMRTSEGSLLVGYFTDDGTRLLIEPSVKGKDGVLPTVWDWRTGKKLDEPIPKSVVKPNPPQPEPRYRLRTSQAGTEVIDLSIQPPPIAGKKEVKQ